MIKTEMQNVAISKTVDVLCDCCGKSCKKSYPPYEQEGLPHDSFEYMELKAHWGFLSDHDLEEWTAQVCENCVVEKLSGIVKFKKINSLNGNEI